jgi:PAS domain S-box-containing protein
MREAKSSPTAAENASQPEAGGPVADEGALGPVFEAVFQASCVPQCLVNSADASVLALNDAWVRSTGVARQEALLNGLAVYGEALASMLRQGALHCGTADKSVVPMVPLGGQAVPQEVRVRATAVKTASAALCLLEILGEPLPSAHRSSVDGGLVASLGEEEARLLQQAQLHPAIEKLAQVGHWTKTHGEQAVVWSMGLYEIAGLQPRAMIPSAEARMRIHPDDLLAWKEARQALDGRETVYRWTRPNGEVRWLRSRMGRTATVSGISVEFGVVQDVTDEWSAKRALADQLAFVSHIAANVPGVIFQAGRSRHGVPFVSFLSESSYDVLGLRAREVIADQRLFFSQIQRDDLKELLASITRCEQEGVPLRTSLRVLAPGRGLRWIQVDASARVDGDGEVVWHGYLSDVTETLKASKAMERQHRMLQAIQASQATFIGLDDKRKAFEGLLASFLGVTDSAYGFVGEVLFDERNQPFLRMQALTNIAWNAETQAMVAAGEETGVEFHNLDTLFGHALRTGETVISNQPKHDARAGGLPPGHPPMESFLAVPIELNGRLVAMVGLANRPEGFDRSVVEFLKPLLGTVRELVMALREHTDRQRTREQLQATSALLVTKSAALQVTFDSISQGLTMVDAQGRVRYYNQRMLELLDLPESVLREEPMHVDLVKYQEGRGDFGLDLELLPQGLVSYARGGTWPPPEKYVRRTRAGRMLEVVTRLLPEGGFVRTYTDVTSYFETQEALREERQRLQWVLEATRPGIWEIDLERGSIILNDRWVEMLGYAPGELQTSSMERLERLIHPEDFGRLKASRQAHYAGETAYYECDLRMRHKSGHWIWVNIHGRVHRRDDRGHPLYVSGTMLDIHDRVTAQEQVHQLNADLEQRVAARTAELERSMRDMEAISYSIAHDLRAPLRSVNGFAALIADEEGGHLSPEARRMFERIAHSSRNMGQMITDMLELLRVVRVELEAVPVDMNQLAHSVSEALAPSAPHALIGIKPLPPVMGDATLLRQVLANLMDNALKYARHREQPEVVLGFDETRRAFYMRDNGMGFDMARAGKLFGLFQRMHANSEVPGTGVGLAIVARIIERHGGRIWAEASPGKGATFWWTLPRTY